MIKIGLVEGGVGGYSFPDNQTINGPLSVKLIIRLSNKRRPQRLTK